MPDDEAAEEFEDEEEEEQMAYGGTAPQGGQQQHTYNAFEGPYPNDLYNPARAAARPTARRRTGAAATTGFTGLPQQLVELLSRPAHGRDSDAAAHEDPLWWLPPSDDLGPMGVSSSRGTRSGLMTPQSGLVSGRMTPQTPRGDSDLLGLAHDHHLASMSPSPALQSRDPSHDALAALSGFGGMPPPFAMSGFGGMPPPFAMSAPAGGMYDMGGGARRMPSSSGHMNGAPPSMGHPSMGGAGGGMGGAAPAPGGFQRARLTAGANGGPSGGAHGGAHGGGAGAWEAAGPQAFHSVSGQRVKLDPAMAATREP
ncbi:hypothetical protein T484DRAFT_1853601, partial [Baffinella frigidus]